MKFTYEIEIPDGELSDLGRQLAEYDLVSNYADEYVEKVAGDFQLALHQAVLREAAIYLGYAIRPARGDS